MNETAAKNFWWKVRIFFSIQILIVIPVFVGTIIHFHKETDGYFAPYYYSSIAYKYWILNRGNIPGLEIMPRQFMIESCRTPWVCEYMDKKKSELYSYTALASLGAALFWALVIYSGRQRKKKDEYIRGKTLVTAKELKAIVKKENKKWGLIPKEQLGVSIAGVPMPRWAETRHLLISGSTGAGKSILLLSLLQQLRERGDRVIVVDADGIFTSRFGQPGDELINPFDKRSKRWSPFAEGLQPYEIEATARSFVPEAEGQEGFFRDAAQQLLAGLMEKLMESGRATNGELARLGNYPQEMIELLDGHPAQALLTSGSAATIGSITTTLSNRLKSMRYLPPEAGPSAFSIRNWVKNGKGWLFLPYLESQEDALFPLINPMLDTVCRAVLNLPETQNGRIWLVIDEAPRLGKINSLAKFLTNARKRGGCAVVCVQSQAQLREKWGRDGAQVMQSCLSSQVVLRASDYETAKAMSDALGEQEIRRHTQSSGNSGGGKSENQQEQITVSKLVLPSEVENLADGHGFLKIVGDHPVARIKLPIPKLGEPRNPTFVPRPDAPPSPADPEPIQATPAEPTPAPEIAHAAGQEEAPSLRDKLRKAAAAARNGDQ